MRRLRRKSIYFVSEKHTSPRLNSTVHVSFPKKTPLNLTQKKRHLPFSPKLPPSQAFEITLARPEAQLPVASAAGFDGRRADAVELRNAVLARHPRHFGAGAAVDVDAHAAVLAVGAELGFAAGDGLE